VNDAHVFDSCQHVPKIPVAAWWLVAIDHGALFLLDESRYDGVIALTDQPVPIRKWATVWFMDGH